MTFIILGEDKLWSSLCNFLHAPVTFLLLIQIFSSSLCSQNTLNLCSKLRVRDQVSHPYKTGGKIVSYILMFGFLDKIRGDKIILTKWLLLSSSSLFNETIFILFFNPSSSANFDVVM
jgi:hypothetical protein